MANVTFLLTKGSVTLHYSGKTKTIAEGDGRFAKVLSAIRENRISDIPSLVDNERFFERQGFEVHDGILQYQGEEMPVELSDRIMAYKENNLPVSSLLNFWENLKKNPSFNSRKQLFKFLENKGHSLTEDGCFIGYRGVAIDFKDKHSGTFDNSPGKVCEIPREMVDDNPDNTCSHGLHVGGYQYAKDFGPKLVLVKVNPKDVVAVPNDYNGQKMRVCRFEVLKEAEGIVENVVYGDVKPLEDDRFEDDDNFGFEDDDLDDMSDVFGEGEMTSDGDYLLAGDSKDYSNNHAKRGPNGKFIAKKKKKTSKKKAGKKRK